MIKVLREDLDIIWVSSYYDMPLKGLCCYNGELARFDIDDEEDFYNITPLSTWGKVKALFNKWAFEICVGRHWTYKNGKQGTFKGFNKLTKFYYWIKR